MPLPRATGERIYANDIAAILSEGRLPYSPDNRSMIRMHLEELTRVGLIVFSYNTSAVIDHLFVRLAELSSHICIRRHICDCL